MNGFDVSVIIPIYNCEKYIKDCLQSVIEQDYKDLKKIQIILVDDGSTDQSLKICKEIKERNNGLNIEIIVSERNEGVSVARNKGILASRGKYLMFIDADDFISSNAITKLVEFFELHYDEIDFVSYTRYGYDEISKKSKILERCKDLNETKVYDLEEDFWAIQPTINCMVKNKYKDNIMFKPELFFHEDTLYNTEIIAKKFRIGNVKEAIYYYRNNHGNNTTDRNENPLYCFEQYMYLFEYLFDAYCDEYGNPKKYIQRLVLNVIRYRIIKDKIFPYYLSGNDWNYAIARLINIIKKIDNENIMNYKLMDKYHKMYLMKLKGEKITLHNTYDGIYSINDEKGKVLLIEKNIEIVVNKFKLKNEKIHVFGFLKSPILFYKKPNMYLELVNKDNTIINEKLELTNTVADMYKTDIEVAKFYKYEFYIDIRKIKSFTFSIIIDDIKLNKKFYFNLFSPFKENANNVAIYDNMHKIQFLNNSFYVEKIDKKLQIKEFLRARKDDFKISEKAAIYKILAKLTSKKENKIWIYSDRSDVFDNAYSQFKHNVKIKDNILKYYVIHGNKKEYKKNFNRDEMKYLLKFGSLKHKLLFLNSDKIISSFSSPQEYNPFHLDLKNYQDYYKYDFIYLQHGILHARLLKMYSKTFTNIDKFVISSEFEKINLIENYDYNENDLIQTGMPRLEDQSFESEVENKIIFAPSWRKYLVGESIKRRRETNKTKFVNSKYYKEIISFLSNQKMINTLKEKKLIIDFKLHPIFEEYKECFDCIKNENITVTIGNVDLSKYKAFITDFSSFQFDYINLSRPIMYFVPDMDEFRAGLHSYRELDLQYKDAFGKLCLSGDELLKELNNLINNNYKVEEIYKERMDKFLYKVDNRKDKLYKILKNNN